MANETTILGLDTLPGGSLSDLTELWLPVDDNTGAALTTYKVAMQTIISQVQASQAEVQANTIAAARALTGTATTVYVKGHSSTLDGGEGLFRLIASSGGDPADIGSGGDDDGGWHYVNASGAVYGRDSVVAYPEHFGAFGTNDVTAAAASADRSTAMQRWLDLWSNPSNFPGAVLRTRWQKPRFEAHARFYRCDSTLNVTIPQGSPSWYGGIVQSDLVFFGSVFQIKTLTKPIFRVVIWRSPGKPHIHLRYYRELNSGKTAWNARTFPRKFRDPNAYRTWSTSTAVYAGEFIKYQISSVYYLYKVTVGGITHASTGPTTSTSPQTNGTATLLNVGSITTSAGKWMRDLICEERDIGVWVDQLDTDHDLHIDGENTAIGILVCPRGGQIQSCGFATIKSKYLLGCKWGIVQAAHLYDYLVADATARKALTGVSLDAVVRQSNDAVNDYVFQGPLGQESQDSSWYTRTARTQPGWTNDVTFDCNLIYGRGNVVLDTTQSVYGLVTTAFGTNIGPTGNWSYKIGVEFSSPDQTDNAEMIHTVWDVGNENETEVRNDSASRAASSIALTHVDSTECPTKNFCRTRRGGRLLDSADWQTDQNNGYFNCVEEIPYGRHAIKEFTVPNLLEDAIFSAHDRIYFRRSGTWEIDKATPSDFMFYRFNTGAGYGYFNADDLTFNFTAQQGVAVWVELPFNHAGDAFLEVEPYFSRIDSSTKNQCRIDIAVYDPNTPTDSAGLIALSPWPRIFGGHPGLTVDDSTYPLRPHAKMTANRATGYVVGFQPWVRRIAVRLWGDRMRGYSFRLRNCPGGGIFPAKPARQQLTDRVNAVPERGVFRAPSRFYLNGVSATVKELNKAAGTTDYWACTGTVASRSGIERAWEWAHDGAGNMKEWNPNTLVWDTIKTGITPITPTDWIDT